MLYITILLTESNTEESGSFSTVGLLRDGSDIRVKEILNSLQLGDFFVLGALSFSLLESQLFSQPSSSELGKAISDSIALCLRNSSKALTHDGERLL